LYIIFSTRLSL